MSEPSRPLKCVIREFDYRPNRLQTLVLFLLACAGEAIFCYLACNLDEPVDVKGFRLTARQGRLLMTGFAFLGPIGLLALGSALVSSLFQQRRVAITEDSLILPKPTWHGLGTTEIEVPFATIKAATVCPFIGNSRLLRVEREAGAISIPNNMFPQRRDFEELVTLLSAARNAAAERMSSDHTE